MIPYKRVVFYSMNFKFIFIAKKNIKPTYLYKNKFQFSIPIIKSKIFILKQKTINLFLKN